MYCFKLVNLDPARLDKIKWILASGIINKDVWLAGGSLRTLIDPNDKVCDYDLFFRDTELNPFESLELTTDNNSGRVMKVIDRLERLGFKCTFECPEGKLFTYSHLYCHYCECFVKDFSHSACFAEVNVKEVKVQLICEHFYESPEHLLSTFDLSPCTFATDGEFVWMYKEGIKDVRDKVVHVRNLTYPIPTMKRIIKYAGKGYETNVACQEFVNKLSNLIETKGISASELDRIYID